jgi:hypothetical protein
MGLRLRRARTQRPHRSALRCRSECMAGAPRTRTRPSGWILWSFALAALALLAVGCSPSGPDDPFDEADFRPGDGPELGPPPEEVNLPDTRGVVLSPVPGAGAPTVPVKIFGGDAVLYGQVSTAEAGGSGGAVVRLERFVGFDSAVEEVPVAANGTWEADRLIGGRYRVRAYRSPDLAMISSEVFFLPAEDEVRLDLAVARFGGIDLQAAFLASGVPVGGSATVTALAQEIRVDGDGIVRGEPLAGATITADAGSGWSIEGAARAVGADGLASGTVTCTDPSAGDITHHLGRGAVLRTGGCRPAAHRSCRPPTGVGGRGGRALHPAPRRAHRAGHLPSGREQRHLRHRVPALRGWGLVRRSRDGVRRRDHARHLRP